MRIGIQILYTEGWEPIAEIVLPVAHMYCEKHGYELLLNVYPEPYPPQFGFRKLTEATKNLWGNDFDVIVSMDLDCLITNPEIRIESFLDELYDFYICNDFNGLNAGVFIIKKSDWSYKFLQNTMGYHNRPNMHCEQNAIERYISVHGEEKIKILAHPSINSYKYELYPEIPLQSHEQGNWNPTDLLLHLPGIGIDKRVEIFKQVKQELNLCSAN